MSQPFPALPTLDQLVEGVPQPTLFKRLIEEQLGGTIVALILLTRERLLDVRGLSQKRLNLLKVQLAKYGYRFRDFSENILMYVELLFGHTEKAPLEILQISVAIANGSSFSEYLPLTIVRRLRSERPDMTVGELCAMTRKEVAQLFDEFRWAHTAFEVESMLDELERRLAEWNLSLCMQPVAQQAVVK